MLRSLRPRAARPACASALVFLLLCAGCGPPEPAAPAPGSVRLRVATWNVHDLFDESDDPLTEDPVPRHATVERKLARVGAVLARLDADVVVLQEVEHLGLLERLARGPLAPLGYAHLHLVEGRDPRGIDVGVLSRLPFTRLVSHLADRDASGGHLFARDLAEVHLSVAGREVALLGAHLASRREPQDALRAAQAGRVAEIAGALLDASPGALVLVAGDLNDGPAAVPLWPLLGDPRLADPAAALPASLSYTYSPPRYRGRLDYLLVSRNALDWLSDLEVVGGADVDAASDHRPVVIELTVPPQPSVAVSAGPAPPCPG
ncbi:MAG TPA: endonuclease/exonuclease/phosphatase family protein [Anaeromyxobacteraceae bacterium]|nr:endonuclease/exonuclease/phosphatase family protein [Anaeromyxobacteraceae bacterium]